MGCHGSVAPAGRRTYRDTLTLLRFAAARARQTAIVAFVVTSLAFVLVHAAPGDPFATSLDENSNFAAARAEMRLRYALDLPLWQQYPMMLANFARGEFGTSFGEARPVSAVLTDVIPDTLLLMVPALLIGVLAGVVVGTWQGAHAGTWRDRATGAFALSVLSIPEFLLALIASLVFAVRLRWFPGTGIFSAGAVHASWLDTVGDYLHHAALPVSVLALVIGCVVARFQRAAVVDTLNEEFVRTARAKGAATRRVLVHHVLRRTGGSLFAVLGLLVPTLVGGAAMVEMVFGWPGAGATLVSAVGSRDYPLVIALVLVGSIAVCVGSAIADAAAVLANPAIRKEA